MDDSQIEQLRRLPMREGEVWQGALVRMPSWVTGEDRPPYRPWVGVWVAVKADLVSATDACKPEDKSLAMLWDGLVDFATDPKIGGYRPQRVEVRDPAAAEHLQPALAEVGIELVCRPNLPHLNRVMAAMAQGLGRHTSPPGWATGKGVTESQMRRFAKSAGAFYEAQPWRYLSDEDLLVIESPKAPKGMRYANILGNAGQQYGISFYSSPEELWDMHRGGDTMDWLASTKGGMWSLMLGAITDIPFEDADLWADGGLPVAGDEAYPCVIHFGSDSGVQRPDAKRLAFVEILAAALALTSEEQIEQGRWSVAVNGPDGEVQVTLALPDLLDPPDHQEWMRRGFEPERRAMERMHAQIGRFQEDHDFEDFDELNAAIAREFTGKTFDASRYPPRTALEKAQELCYEAFDAHGRRRLQLAREALATCPDCADACVILAEQSATPQAAMAYYARGVEAGRRALGEERFSEDVGHFWGMLDTRPYMRARLGLAQCLDAVGKSDEAAEHYREMLRLNPGDNQGVRYFYLPLLLRLGLDAEAARFMKQAENELSANWTYTRALLAFRLGGDTSTSRAELAKAGKVNPHVLEMLVTDTGPDVLPAQYAPGSVDEAAICVSELGSAYHATPGAIDWLKAEYDRQLVAQKPRRWKQRKRRSR